VLGDVTVYVTAPQYRPIPPSRRYTNGSVITIMIVIVIVRHLHFRRVQKTDALDVELVYGTVYSVIDVV